jgi:hypothetical protein
VASGDLYTTATELAVLHAARSPAWGAPATPTAEPANAGAGVALQGAIKTLVHVSLREETHRRTVRLGITSPDLAAVYTVTIDGTAVAYDAAADTAASLEEVVDGIAAVLNANGAVNQLIEAEAVNDDDGTDTPRTKVRIRGKLGAAYAVNFTQVGPGADPVLSAVADYESAELRLWWYPGARVGVAPPGRWVAPSGPVPIPRFGFLERYDSAGLDRCHVQLLNLLGHPADGLMVTYAEPLVLVGPGLSEIS